MFQALTTKELKKQYGGPNKRNKENICDIKSILTPYTNGVADVHIMPDGKIIGEHSKEIEELRTIDPQILNKIATFSCLKKED